ncbi:MAG: Gfo/Idh/MocA family oxidoreductase [Candidatus Rokubacteria bacterium]|nr:Gfo/Idh/MocA family oxidoreductase [Candidatus Rokubacteria bacterium]
MNVGIVGCGRVGEKRAAALGGHTLVGVADVVPARAAALAATRPGCRAEERWERLVARDDVDIVVVATTHDALVPVSLAAVRAGKHVLVEKPGARDAGELDELIRVARERRALVKVGFNHRYHPALARAKALVAEGAIGELLYLRGRYGHGGRPGYEQEWRADPAVSGGGELLDQGVHLIDLSRWLLGDFTKVTGRVATYYWKMPVEDNAFLMLETARGQVAWLHVSWTEWKNLFALEIFGETGKLEVDGLGGSYGTERLTWYRMRPEMGPPATTAWEYPGADGSWAAEFADFAGAIGRGEVRDDSLRDARAALAVVGAVYGGTAR